jgi:ethanolamine kinase
MSAPYIQSDALFPLAGTTLEKIGFLSALLSLPADAAPLSLTQLSGGITNTVYLFEAPASRFVVRVYGNNTDAIIDRREEIAHILQIRLMAINATFANGLVVEYMEGVACEVPMLADPLISDKIAVALAQMHRVTLGDAPHANQVFDKTLHFLARLDPASDGVEELRARVAQLRPVLERELAAAPVVLCHNDVLSANVIWDSAAQAVSLIDYEYCDWTWPQFDIANHLFEWVGYGFELHRFPSVDRQKRFIAVYLAEFTGREPTDAVVDEWQRQVLLCVPMSGLFWASWGYFQAQNSEVDFPYLEYARIRTMIAGLSLPLPETHELWGKTLMTF